MIEPLTLATGAGIPRTLKTFLSETLVPSGKVPVTVTVASFPCTEVTFQLYPLPDFTKPGADAVTLSSEIPAKEPAASIM